ncbi:hypothetical protein A3I41_05505 [Candidatus Uhrbacteria bacterium RIFCSPLOWO2_02_FULL_48_18]|uniref:Uncharacterized protein n=1 Tax=Candidatus Uhrbacteria bacterium RIFCSPLOWO2_02_FULL_48_18 TaxID=1802408 RepID=A0A1F7V864_9BACT|nr:MAG: hypothetical protein A3B20_00735 [Candidatus Uhrbacteria bacterium RIFCSPLOWO2_01_FULL_47_17]OGL86752.1 MAG: hypothetical protein A3I41_05505 [Candidatus Uhrbacteria bacterium RIFCSPLOWO2_02_FULL_48_18]
MPLEDSIIKNQISEEQLAESLYYFAKKFGIDFVSYEMAKESSPFKKADKEIFAHERLIMIFWIIDAFFADRDRKLTISVHKKYFADLGILNNREEVKKELDFIMSRYKEYYDAYNEKAGAEQYLLGSIVAKNILREDKLVLNILISSLVAMDVIFLVKQLRESIFDKYEIIK